MVVIELEWKETVPAENNNVVVYFQTKINKDDYFRLYKSMVNHNIKIWPEKC